MPVQAVGAEPTIGCVDEGIVGRLARPGEVGHDAAWPGPQVHVARDELAALIDADRLRIARPAAHPVERRHHVFAAVAEHDPLGGGSLIGAAGLTVERRAVEPDGPTSRPDRHPLPGSACLHAREGPVRRGSRKPVPACDRASYLSPDHVHSPVLPNQWRSQAHHLAIQRQVSHDLLQPRVLVLELLRPLHLGRQQAGTLPLPVETRRLADPGLPADLGNRGAPSPCSIMNAFCASANLLAVARFHSSPSQESVAENSSL